MIDNVGHSICASILTFAYYALVTLVLLYSRLTGLTNVFTFQHSKSYSNLAQSSSDPYLLPLPNGGPDVLAPRTNPYGSHRNSRVTAIILKAMKYESPQGSIPSGLGQIYFERDVAFYQLSLLTNDLALSECLYAELPNEFKTELCPPDTISRLKIAKTPAQVHSDFIVPNGYLDRDVEDLPHNGTADEGSDTDNQASLAVLDEDPCTISFEWLENEIRGTLTNTSPTTAFDRSLELLQNDIEEKFVLGLPTIETLYV